MYELMLAIYLHDSSSIEAFPILAALVSIPLLHIVHFFSDFILRGEVLHRNNELGRRGGNRNGVYALPFLFFVGPFFWAMTLITITIANWFCRRPTVTDIVYDFNRRYIISLGFRQMVYHVVLFINWIITTGVYVTLFFSSH